MNTVCAIADVDDTTLLCKSLLANAVNLKNEAYFARIIAAQRSAKNCLPLHLGLDITTFSELMQRYFPGCLFWLALHSGHELALARGTMRQQLLEMRRDEWRDIYELLLSGRRGEDQSEQWLAAVVAAGCLGGDHLWRDLGLSSRVELGELLRYNFPGVALRNTNDMKWKKFFYKQLCEQQGSYVCRAPSCDQCVVYADCFGPEH